MIKSGGFEYFNPPTEVLKRLGLTPHLNTGEQVRWVMQPSPVARFLSDFDAYTVFVLGAMAFGLILVVFGWPLSAIAHIELLAVVAIFIRFACFVHLSANYFFWISDQRFGFRFLGTGYFEKLYFKNIFGEISDGNSGFKTYDLQDLCRVIVRQGRFNNGEIYLVNSQTHKVLNTYVEALTYYINNPTFRRFGIDLDRKQFPLRYSRPLVAEVRKSRLGPFPLSKNVWWGVSNPTRIAQMLIDNANNNPRSLQVRENGAGE